MRASRPLLSSSIAVAFTACGGGGGSSDSASPANAAPTISGTAPNTVVADQPYSFQPTANDANGDSLTFAIANAPQWTMFDSATGRLSGTPTAGDVGTHGNITISVSDGRASAALPAFSITVHAAAAGSVTLDWVPPTANTDGSTLTNLAGYRILYGTSPSSLTQTIDLANPGLTSYVVQNLSPATWYFAIKTYNSAGIESAPSNPVSSTLH